MVNKQAFASTSELYVLSKPLNGRLKIQDSQVSMYVKELNSLMHLHCLLRQNIGPYFHYCLSNVHYCEDHFHVHFFVRSSHVWSSYLYSHFHTTPRVYLETNITTSSSWLVQSVGRVLQQYRRGHGFKSRTGLIFTTAYVVFITAKIASIFISLSAVLKLINNSCWENKGNYNREGGLDMWS